MSTNEQTLMNESEKALINETQQLVKQYWSLRKVGNSAAEKIEENREDLATIMSLLVNYKLEIQQMIVTLLAGITARPSPDGRGIIYT